MRHQVYKFDTAKTLSDIKDLAVEREFVRVTGGKGGSFTNIIVAARGETQAPWTATGFKFQKGGTDWVLKNCSAAGFRTHPREGKKYWQGDGFSTELPNERISFIDCLAKDCADGGFDIKGPDWFMDDCTGERNSKNFRFWSSGTAKKLTSIDPRTCHIQVCVLRDHPVQQVIEIEELHATGDKPLLLVDTPKDAIPPKIIIREITASGLKSFIKISGPKPEIIWPTP